MGLSSVKGDQFKKMVMKATGTKKYFSSGMKKELRDMKAAKYLKPGAKVSKAKAKQIMKELKTNKRTKNVVNSNKYVEKSYAAEKRRRDNIKRQNVADMNRSRQEAAKQSKTNAQSKVNKNMAQRRSTQTTVPINNTAGTPGQSSGPNRMKVGSESAPEFTGSSYGHTNLKPKHTLPTPIQKPKEWQDEEDNIIDMVID